MDRDADPLGAAIARIDTFGGRIPIDLGHERAGRVSVASFLADEVAMRDFLAYEASFNPRTDQKAAAAFMFMDYTLGLFGIMVPLALQAGLVPDLAPGRALLQVRLGTYSHDGQEHEQRQFWFRPGAGPFATLDRDLAEQPAAVLLPDQTALCDRFRQEAEAHLLPVIERLTALTRLPRRALWRLAADTIAAGFLDQGRMVQREADARDMALRIIRQPGSPLDNRQVGYFTLSVSDDAGGRFDYTFRARGGCCRYYTVEGGELCTTCVLKPQPARDDDLRLAMRRHLGLSAAPG